VVCGILLVAVIATKTAVVAGLGAFGLILAYAYSPRAYSISEQCIIVNRLIGNVRIPLDGLREIRAASKDDFRGCIRLFGNGGLFGYYGLFRTSKLGKSTWYITSRRNSVVVITGATTVVFSPDDVDGFIAVIRTSAPVPVTQPNEPLPGSMRSYGGGSLVGKLIGVAIGILGLGVAAVAMLYSPGPPSYTLTHDSLTIHDRFYPITLNAAAVDVEHIRIVDFSVDRDWQPTARTNGFANSHYHSGWFRVASGKTVRMYRADSKRLVLLPPNGDGTPVLLETPEPEEFVRKVRQEWSSHS
jgi:hypothetical protein